jgi:parallel beta-helix repeat protein
VGKGLRDLRAGSFHYDPSSKALFAWLPDGSDPNRHTMEASVLDFLIPPVSRDFIVLEGLNLSHSNVTSRGILLGMANVWGKSWVIRGCTFNQADLSGIALTGEGHRIEGCTFNNNGNVGISITGSGEKHRWGPVPDRVPQNIVLDGNETSFNNYRNFELSFQHGGIKGAVSCRAIRVSRHKALSNNGAGIWFALHCRSVIVRDSVVSNNLVGIGIESSDDGVVAGNLVTGNRYQGIYVAASSDVTVGGTRWTETASVSFSTACPGKSTRNWRTTWFATTSSGEAERSTSWSTATRTRREGTSRTTISFGRGKGKG